jgi:MoaA/NifB/PqqE/SkfB family radical SAM enzyme
MSEALKFIDPQITAAGKERARVALDHLEILWFNTGSLCNLACRNCYMGSSPQNDSLAFLTVEDIQPYLDELAELSPATREIGLTGGEPLINPQIMPILQLILQRGFSILLLTNGFHVISRHRQALLGLDGDWRTRLRFRVSLDQPKPDAHDRERVAGSFATSLRSLCWLRQNGFPIAVAGRLFPGTERSALLGEYQELFVCEGLGLDAWNGEHLVLFPEMDGSKEVPEISTECWGILGKSPNSVMCAKSRMVVRLRGQDQPQVQACTLMPIQPGFTTGRRLADMRPMVALNHPHCARFCVLGGASCG